MLGKVYFRRSHPTGRTPDYLSVARRAVTKTPWSNSNNEGWSQSLLHAGKYCSRSKQSIPFRSLSSLKSKYLNGYFVVFLLGFFFNHNRTKRMISEYQIQICKLIPLVTTAQISNKQWRAILLPIPFGEWSLVLESADIDFPWSTIGPDQNI